MDQRAINEREWHDPANWRGGILGLYSSEADSRLLVPKRHPAMGWTLNFARPGARFLMGLILAAAAVAAVSKARR
ncbi:MAG TPA: DUF5808 domain-containing protein [Gemmatimonadales bacterium]|nr:DUF5808 domain-containing protein [Gemmatimonadales bacterium]